MDLDLHFCEVAKTYSRKKRHQHGFDWWKVSASETITPIRHFSHTFFKGEKVYISGPNGRGKTTLLKLAVGLLSPTRGHVRIGSRSVRRFNKKNFGVLFSNQLLYSKLTGYQNLAYSGHLYGVAELSKKIAHKAEFWDLENLLHHEVSTYSQGQRMRLALARATLQDPSIVVLDEPFAFLDARGCKALTTYLRTSPSTVLLTGQNPTTKDVTREIQL